MQYRTLGPFKVSAIGYGSMSLSHAYGPPTDPKSASQVLNRALDLGYTLLDTAALYGFGANESLVGSSLKQRRHEYVLASKCGLFRNAAGQREVNGHPRVLKATCEDSLRRLQTDVIDLYYLHRLDRRVPIEDSIGALSDLCREGKIRAIGLSEVSAETLRKAHAVHPVTALQNEYSLMTRNPELGTLQACRELGISLVAFSPVARGFLSDVPLQPGELDTTDIRRGMPRFQGEAFQHNLDLLAKFGELAEQAGCSRAQLALAWLLSRGDHVIPIPGTTSAAHLAENISTLGLHIPLQILQAADTLINQQSVRGPRYPDSAMQEIDTEEF